MVKLTNLNVPNWLTLLRVSLIPIFVIVFYLPWRFSELAATAIFVVAGITDWLDGYLARKLNQESAFGQFLDPVADKLIVAVALVLLVQVHATIWLTIPAAVIICREIGISALREWMAELGKRANVSVSYLGKIKTVAQIVAIILLLSQSPTPVTNIVLAGYFLLYLAVLLTLWSMVYYLYASWQCINNSSS